MAKFYGPVGYSESVGTSDGVWSQQTITRNYYGDVISFSKRWTETSDSTNDDLNIDSQISIVADPFAYQNFSNILYVEYLGVKWKVSKVTPRYPRLVLTLGGVYNG